MTKMAEKPYPLGHTYLYSAYKGVAPLPRSQQKWGAKWVPVKSGGEVKR